MRIEDKSYGVVLFLRGNPDRFLILHQTNGAWSFPKGHKEGTETPRETAIRELREEAGITDATILDLPAIHESYTFEQDGDHYEKTVEYCIAEVTNDTVVIQEKEIAEYKWATYDEALATFNFENSKEVLLQAKTLLEKYDGK